MKPSVFVLLMLLLSKAAAKRPRAGARPPLHKQTDTALNMNAALCLAITLPFGLPDWLASGWWWLLLWPVWLYSLWLFGMGLYFFLSDPKGRVKGKLICPFWVYGLLFVAWLVAQILAWWLGNASWSSVMLNGAIFGLLAFLLGMISLLSRTGVVIFAVLLWFSWPKLKEYGLLLADAVPPMWSKLTAFVSGEKPEEPATVESARAELDGYLQKWKTNGVRWLGTPEGGSFFSDIHHGLGFDLGSYSIGPGRKLEEGVFEFRVLMEVSKYSLGRFVTYHSEKVVTVIHFPRTHKVARERQRKWAVVATGGMTTEDAVIRTFSESQDILRDSHIHFRRDEK